MAQPLRFHEIFYPILEYIKDEISYIRNQIRRLEKGCGPIMHVIEVCSRSTLNLNRFFLIRPFFFFLAFGFETSPERSKKKLVEERMT